MTTTQDTIEKQFVKSLSALVSLSYDRVFEELSTGKSLLSHTDLAIAVLASPKLRIKAFQKPTPINHHSMKVAVDYFAKEFIPEPVRGHGYYRTRLINTLMLLNNCFTIAAADHPKSIVGALAAFGQSCDELKARLDSNAK